MAPRTRGSAGSIGSCRAGHGRAWRARILLGLLQKAFGPDGEPIVAVVDDTIERRRGARIRDKGIYRDAVRSSRSFFVKVEGLRWLSFQLAVRLGFARRT